MTTPRETGDDPLDFGALLSETIDDLARNLAPYALAALGVMVIVMPVGMVVALLAVFGVPAGFALVAAVAGAALDGGSGSTGGPLVAIATMLGLFASFGLLGTVIGAGFAPFYASIHRAVAAHQRGEGGLGFGSAFSTFGKDLFAVVGVAFVTAAASMVGLLFCYVGAFVPTFLFGFAPLLVAVRGLGPFEALRVSARHAMDRPLDHALFAAAWFVAMMFSGYLPVIGVAFVWALQVRAYRKLFGDEAAPA